MIVRDKDVLASMTSGAGCTVYISVPTVDEDAWRLLEPGTAPPLKRLRAVRELVDAGVRPRRRPDEFHCPWHHPEGGTRDHFMKWLALEFPDLVDGYTQLYAGKYAPSSCRKEVATVIGMLRNKYGVGRRGGDGEDAAVVESAPRAAEQQMLTFKQRR